MVKLNLFEAHLKRTRGEVGSKGRTKFDAESLVFKIGAMLKEARKEAKMTQ